MRRGDIMDGMMQELEYKTALVERYLREHVTPREGYRGVLFEAMSYSLLAGGKRLRPVLALAFCELAGGKPEQALPFAAGIEMIHTYSLIHDDLPCMDDDAMRRGKPTSHIKYGEATALLAGDALLTEAFYLMASGSILPPEQTAACIRLIADAAGPNGMVSGQILDMAAEAADAAGLDEVNRLKTGALIRCAAEAGVTAGSGSETDMKQARIYAENLGLAFQIKDDILDVEGASGLLGKPTGSDVHNGKHTYVTAYGLTGAKEALSAYTCRALDALASYGAQADFLRWLADYLLTREK